MNRTDFAGRVEAVLELGALGGFLGSPLEGKSIQDRRLDETSGDLTDDTMFTVATARAIADSGLVQPEQIAGYLLRAFRDGVAGIGSSTLGAMQALAAGQHWAPSGISGDRAAGNGAALRIAPLAFVLDPSDTRATQLILDTARITHRNGRSGDRPSSAGRPIRSSICDLSNAPSLSRPS